MPNPVSTVSKNKQAEAGTQPVRFSVQGRTCQKAALYIYETSWGEVRWGGEQAVEGVIYKFPPNLRNSIYKSLAIGGSGRFARAQNLACLQRSLTGRVSDNTVEQVASRLIDEMNSEKASKHSLDVSAKLESVLSAPRKNN
jgi:hypothetical protein